MRGFVILLPLALTTCVEEQRAQAAKCELEAARMFPTESMEQISPRAGHFISTCMAAAGYRSDPMQSKCNPAGWRNDANPYCYFPSGRVARWIYEYQSGSKLSFIAKID